MLLDDRAQMMVAGAQQITYALQATSSAVPGETAYSRVWLLKVKGQ